MEENDALENLRKEVEKRRSALVISRMPDWAKEEFQRLSSEEYCNDYGWCLSDLLKERKFYSDGISELAEVCASLEQRISKLEGQPNKSRIKMGSGRIVEKEE